MTTLGAAPAAAVPLEFDTLARWSDQDRAGHVNNVQIAGYLQEARTDLLLAGPCRTLLDDGIVVTAHQLEYLHEIHYHPGRPLRTRIWTESVGAARLVLAYEILSGNVLAHRATTTLCPIDFDDGKVRRFTDQERSWFAERTLPEGRDGFPLRRVKRREIGDAPAHRHPVQVRWSDVDRYGHVNNTTYLEYFQEGRIQALRDNGMGIPGLQIMVARQDVEYHSQTEPRRHPYEVVSAVQSLGVTSSVVAQELRDAETGEVKASGRTVQVLTRDGVPVRMPPAIRASADGWLLPG